MPSFKVGDVVQKRETGTVGVVIRVTQNNATAYVDFQAGDGKYATELVPVSNLLAFSEQDRREAEAKGRAE